MQASKIVIGKSYAIRVRGELQELRVGKIVSTRTSGTTESAVYGTIMGVKRDPETNVVPVMTGPIPVEAMLGEYTEHKELVDAKLARDAEKRSEELKIEMIRDEAFKLLVKILTPSVDEKYRIEKSFRGITIYDEMLPDLIAFLKGDFKVPGVGDVPKTKGVKS